MIPSVGRIVHYRLASSDLAEIESTKTSADRHGNPHHEGQVVPMLICRVFADDPSEGTAVNGQAFIDGDFSIWVTSRVQGDGPCQWADPRG